MRTSLRACGLFIGFGVVVATATGYMGDVLRASTDVLVEPPVTPPPSPTPAPSTPAAPATPETKPTEPSKSEPVDPYVLNFTVKDIDGKEQNLEQYKGKVILFVNVASKCGFTRQYKGLEELYLKNKDSGLVILGFPSNDFGGQEPGAESEIKSFCESTYKVTFPLFSKIAVVGPTAHPLYVRLAAQPGAAGGPPKWNFTKYLVGRDGKVIERFDSRVKPDAEELVNKINAALKAK